MPARRRKRGRPKKLSKVMASAARKRNSMKTKAERSAQARKAAQARWSKAAAAALRALEAGVEEAS